MDTAFGSSLQSCCEKFRTGHNAEASVLLDQWLGQWAEKASDNPALMNDAACQSLSVALDCQERQDWIALADELEFVLGPRISTLAL